MRTKHILTTFAILCVSPLPLQAQNNSYLREDIEGITPPQFQIELPSYSDYYTVFEQEVHLFPNVIENNRERYELQLNRVPYEDCLGAPVCQEYLIVIEKIDNTTPSLWSEISQQNAIGDPNAFDLTKEQITPQEVDLGETVGYVLPAILQFDGHIFFDWEGKRYKITKSAGRKEDLIKIAKSIINNPIIIQPKSKSLY